MGVEYRTRLLDYGPMMKSAEYLAINPMGKVPAIRHGDTIVTEVAAICAYLADVFPAAGLAPSPAHRGAYYRWLFFAAGPLEAAVTNRAFGFAPPADKEATVGYGNFSSVMRAPGNGGRWRRVRRGRDVHRGRRLCRIAHRLGPAIRHDRQAAGIRDLLVAAQRTRSVPTRWCSRRYAGKECGRERAILIRGARRRPR